MKLWFQEEIDEGVRVALRVENVLFRGQSEFQTVDVVETQAYGRCLLIDGLVMVTDMDEFVYHEMITHIPALLHKNPRHALVIGGGDGGTVRELLKHPSIESIVLCEIDKLVVDASRQYFPNIACGLDDPRVRVNIGDGIAYMRDHAPASLDLVLVDSTDPFGPGEGLFSRDFYRSVARALRPDGLMACQSESPWFEKPVLQRIANNIRGGFQHMHPYIGSIPTYPRGLWSWTLAANHKVDVNAFDRKRLATIQPSLQYLSEGLIPGVFAIPPFFHKKVFD